VLLVLLGATACSYERFIYYPLEDEDFARLSTTASGDLSCSERDTQQQYRTLLTRTVQGCDQRAVYAYDYMLDRWFFDFSPSPVAASKQAAPAR
jgi:hypothetical protein